VHDALLMGILQTPRRLEHAIDRQRDGERPLLLHQGIQVPAFDVFHGKEMAPLGLIGVEGGDDVRVRQPGSGLDLAMEPFDRLIGVGGQARQHLQGYDPAHEPVPRLVHLAHPSLAQPVQDHVIAHHQTAGFALVDRLGLEAGQLALAVQLLGQIASVTRLSLGRHKDHQTPYLVGRHQAALGQGLNELFEGDDFLFLGRAVGLRGRERRFRLRPSGSGHRLGGRVAGGRLERLLNRTAELRESRHVLVGRDLLPSRVPIPEFQQEQLAQQHRAYRIRGLLQMRLEGRLGTRLPGVLEGQADPLDLLLRLQRQGIPGDLRTSDLGGGCVTAVLFRRHGSVP